MGKMSKHHHQQSSKQQHQPELQLGNFTGRKWGDWERACEQNGVRADSNNGYPGGSKKQNEQAEMEVKQITRKEQPLFGFHPDREQVYVVICEHCKRPFKPQAFQCHLENNHRSYRKEKVVRESHRPTTTSNVITSGGGGKTGKNFRNKNNNKQQQQQFTHNKLSTSPSGNKSSSSIRDVTPTSAERMKPHGGSKSGVSLKIPNRKSSTTVVPTPTNAKLVASSTARGGTPEPKNNAPDQQLKKQLTPSSGERYSVSPSSLKGGAKAQHHHHHHHPVKKVAPSAGCKVTASPTTKVAAPSALPPQPPLHLPHDGAILNGGMTSPYTKHHQQNNNKHGGSKPDSKPPTPTPSFDVVIPQLNTSASSLLYHVPRSPAAVQLPPPTPTGQLSSQQHGSVMSSSSSSGGSPLPQLPTTAAVVQMPPTTSRPSSRGKCIPLKEREYDPDKHCGVPTGRELSPCTRSLTCKTHTINMKRKVIARRKPYDDLLREARNNQQMHRMLTSSTNDHLPVRLRHTSSHGSDVSSPETRTGSSSSGSMMMTSHHHMMTSHDSTSSNHQRNSNFFFPLRQTPQIRCIDCNDAQPQHNNIHHYNNYMTSSFLTYHPRPLVQTNQSVLSRFNKSRKRKKFSSFSKLTNLQTQAPTNTQTTTNTPTTKFQFTPIASSVTPQSPTALPTTDNITKNKMAASSSGRKRGASSEQENGGGGQRRLSSGSSSSGSKRSKLQSGAGGKKNKVQVVDISSVMMHNNNQQQQESRQNSLATLLQQPPQSGGQSFKRPTGGSGGGKFIVTTGGGGGGKNHVIAYTSSSLPPSSVRGGSGATQSKTTRKLMMTSAAVTKQQQRRMSGNNAQQQQQQRVTPTSNNLLHNQQALSSSALYGATAGHNVVTVTSEAGSSAYTLMDLVDTLGPTPTSSSNNQIFDGEVKDATVWPQNGGFILNNQQNNNNNNRNPTIITSRRIRNTTEPIFPQNNNNNNNNNAASNLVDHFIQGTSNKQQPPQQQQRINIKTTNLQRRNRQAQIRRINTQQPQRIITTNNQQQQNIIFSINTSSADNRRQQIIQIPKTPTTTNYYTTTTTSDNLQDNQSL